VARGRGFQDGGRGGRGAEGGSRAAAAATGEVPRTGGPAGGGQPARMGGEEERAGSGLAGPRRPWGGGVAAGVAGMGMGGKGNWGIGRTERRGWGRAGGRLTISSLSSSHCL